MKTKIKSIYLLALTFAVLFVSSCETNNEFEEQKQDILPQKFGVDVPSSISYEDGVSNGRYGSNSRVKSDTINGGDIYGNLGTFIWVGDNAAEIVNDVIGFISGYEINQALVLTFKSDEDGRDKTLTVIEGAEFEGKQYEFELTITDTDSESNEDGGLGLQIFWNRNPIDGVAIMNFYNLNRIEHENDKETMVRIDYSEDGSLGYEEHMIVSITELTLANPLEDPWSIGSLKMFAGRNGFEVDVYGNSDHPNAIFISGNVGFNWAFVASGNDQFEVGVAEVGLPSNDLNTSDRNVILKENSIKNVLTNEIQSVWPDLPQSILDAYLFNAEAPGFFATTGFVQGGTSPSDLYDPLLENIEELSPYNPKDIKDLSISFQKK